MRPPSKFRLAALVALLLTSCASPVSPTAFAGNFELVSVSGVALGDGPGVVAGALRLRTPSFAERRITYVAPDGTRSEQVLTGTFTVDREGIALALRDGAFVWRPPVVLQRDALTITYPSPADGPAIVERYERR